MRIPGKDDDAAWIADPDDDIPDSGVDWRRAAGSFVLIPVLGEAGMAIDEMRRLHDPKLANTNAPHLSLIGSSGAGPILPSETPERISRARLIVLSRSHAEGPSITVRR